MKFIVSIFFTITILGCHFYGKKTVDGNKPTLNVEDAKLLAVKAWERDYDIDSNSYLIDVSLSSDTNVWYVVGTLKTNYKDGYQIDENGDSVLILTNRSFIHALIGRANGEIIRIYRTK
ncbi:MAG: hypothetical protein ACK4WD_08545 [Flavobacteriales bacterium]